MQNYGVSSVSFCVHSANISSSVLQKSSCRDYAAAVRYKIMIQEGCETKRLGLFECGWQRCIANNKEHYRQGANLVPMYVR